MGITGAIPKVRVDGRGDHDLGTFEWTKSREKTPFTPIGNDDVSAFTAGPLLYTFTATVQSKPDGTYAIDWDSWCANNWDKPLVIDSGGRKERLVGVVIDEIANTVDQADGTWKKALTGKFKSLLPE
jgi:hypothetical protein